MSLWEYLSINSFSTFAHLLKYQLHFDIRRYILHCIIRSQIVRNFLNFHYFFLYLGKLFSSFFFPILCRWSAVKKFYSCFIRFTSWLPLFRYIVSKTYNVNYWLTVNNNILYFSSAVYCDSDIWDDLLHSMFYMTP